MDYLKPDRSNRPTDADDPTGGTTELGVGKERTVELADGRIALVEIASVDGCTLVYYYFDRSGLEDASTEELKGLFEEVGVNFEPSEDWFEAHFGNTKKDDAQGRPIWEFQVTYW